MTKWQTKLQIGKPINRRQFLKIGALSGMSLVTTSILTACGAGVVEETAAPAATSAGSTAVPSAPKIMRIALAGDPSNLNQLQASLSTVDPLYAAIFEPLTKINLETATAEGLLAEAWSLSDDQLTWTFKLREGVKFHNGEDLTAEAVKMSWDTAVKFKSISAARIGLDTVVAVIDDHTVSFTTTQPYVLLPAVLARDPIYPLAYYAEVGDDGMAAHPIGTGMYKFVSQVTGGEVVLERNENYWGGQVSMDGLVFVGMPEDTTRVAALEAGEIDLCINLPPDDAERLKDDPNFQLSWTPLAMAMMVFLLGRQDERLNDVLVRQAFNHAVDKSLLVNNIMLGFSEVLRGQLVGDDAFGYNPNLEPFEYDVEKAKALLAEAGYPDGITFEYQSSQGRYSKQKEVSEALVGELAKAGITVNLEMIEWGEYVNRVVVDHTSAPLAYIGLAYYPLLDSDMVMAYYTSQSTWKLLDDGELNEIYQASRSEFDPDKRAEIIRNWHAVAREKAPTLFLFQAPHIFGLSKRLQGFVATPDHIVHLEGVTIAS